MAQSWEGKEGRLAQMVGRRRKGWRKGRRKKISRVGLVASHEDWSVFDKPARRRTRVAMVLDRPLMVVQSLNLRRRESLSTNVNF